MNNKPKLNTNAVPLAIKRQAISLPVKYWDSRLLIKGNVLDYGCGFDPHGFQRFDPVHAPDYKLLTYKWDTVLCVYVLSHIPSIHGKVETLLALRSLMTQTGSLNIAVASKNTPLSRNGWERLLDQFFRFQRADNNKFFGWTCRQK